jgi:RecB family exonuclease
MLYCHIIKSPEQKTSLFSQWVEGDSHWIVNDLESKFWVQDFLQSQGAPVIHSDRVLRASELWQKLLLLNDPSWQPLSSHFSEFVIEKWMEEILQGTPYRLSSKDRGRAYKTIGQLLPLIGHFQGEDIMTQWFADKDEARQRWQDWHEMGQALWLRFLEKKVVPQEWMKAVLVNEELATLGKWPLIVDLGVQIDDVESELLLNLSRNHEVHIIIPESEEGTEVYQNLIGRGQVQKHSWEMTSPKSTCKKLPSMLAEVKEAVACVRSWLDEGLLPQQLAIVSPQIENYWPTLYEHGRVEGLPLNKNISTPLSQISVYQSWMSHLRLAARRLLQGDPEQVVFGALCESPEIAYRDFKSLFSNVYETEDLQRNPVVERQIANQIDPAVNLSLSAFLEQTIHWVPNSSLSAFAAVLEDLDPVFAMAEELRFSKWVEFFERYFARNERTLVAGDPQGVHVLPLMAAHNPNFKKVVMVGLSESHLLESFDTALHWSDIESIKINFGFSLPHADRHRLIDELEWFERKDLEEVVYTHGETDFAGQFQAPSLFWLQKAMTDQQTDLTSPRLTRWDQLAQNNPRADLPWSEETFVQCEQGIQRDRGDQPTQPVPYKDLRVSPSSFDNFFKCPFKFFASKALHLQEDPLLDLDIDPRSKGDLLHKICEVVVDQQLWALTEAETADLVESCRKQKKLAVYTEAVWQFLKPFYVQATRAFIQFERQWRQEHPETETFAVEQLIETHIQLSEGSFQFNEEKGIPFRGVIDRIDRNSENQVVLIDYKSSTASLNQYKSWVKKGQIQLVLYSIALIEGVLGDENRDVVGAFYFALNQPERKLGFALSHASEGLLKVKKTVPPEEWQNIIRETKALVFKMLQDLQDGTIEPSPNLEIDEKLCEKCDWNQLCRYPSLNL